MSARKFEELKEWLDAALLEQSNLRLEFEENMTQRMNQIINQNAQDKKDIGQAIVTLRKEITEEINKLKTELVETTLQNLNTSTGPLVITQGTEVPKFKNNKDKHPYKFLEDLEIYFKKMNIKEEEKLDVLRECMQETASDWFSIYKLCWETYEDFRQDFLEYFWSEAEQNQLRQQINTTVWKNGEVSMANHFAHYIGLAKTLKEPWPENLLIDQVMHHFPKYIQSMWTLVPNKNFKTATEFLRHQDNVSKPGPSNVYSKNTPEKTEKFHNQHRQGPYQRPKGYMQPIYSSTPKQNPRRRQGNGKQLD